DEARRSQVAERPRSEHAAVESADEEEVEVDGSGAIEPRVAHLRFPLRHALGDDLHRGHGDLAELRVARDLALHAFALRLQEAPYAAHVSQRAIDLGHLRAGHAVEERVDVGYRLLAAAVSLRTAQ